jgi:hypothetical protein
VAVKSTEARRVELEAPEEVPDPEVEPDVVPELDELLLLDDELELVVEVGVGSLDWQEASNAINAPP